MFLKFEKDSDVESGHAERVVECSLFDVTTEDDAIHVAPDNTEPYVLVDQPGHWRRVYVMNESGKTVDKIFAPKNR